MLVEFSVQNFRSIYQRQTLSLVASKDKTFLDTHTIETKVLAVPRVLRTVALYGANGSGKSNLINAMGFFQWFVKNNFSRSPDDLTLQMPFIFQSKEKLSEAGEFEVILLIDGVRYQYGFQIDSQRILEEWLLVYKTQKGQAWFERKYQPEADRYEYRYSDKLLGTKKVWEDSTRSNALFLSTAVQFNSEMLIPVHDWIVKMMAPFNFFGTDNFNSDSTKSLLVDQASKNQILSFLQRCDIPISEFHQSEKQDLFFQHKIEDHSYYIPFISESLGTQRLFTLAAPILSVLEAGKFAIIDELESSLHPLLVQRLLEMFHDPNVNTKGAQLIFTTHNTLLLDQSMFRRDQIWMVEKDSHQATNLVPLTDFQIRKDLSLEKAYLQGRFGAIPILTAAEP